MRAVLVVERSLSLLQNDYNILSVERQSEEREREEGDLTQRAQRKSTEGTEKRGHLKVAATFRRRRV
jgi:hypothetical protein